MKNMTNSAEEITNFPVQDTFNFDCLITEDGEEDSNGVCHADKQAGSGE